MAATRENVLKALAPCGLSCERCYAYQDGPIVKLAIALKEELGNFGAFAERFAKRGMSEFENWAQFKTLLDYIAAGDCQGCRLETCCAKPDCGVAECQRTGKMDFCYECAEFPCKKTNFDPHLEARWLAMNNRMKEIGIEAYYEETRTQPRYK